ncbi:hypothetical protein CZ774_08535 [Frigoribacterium sp. JB110]|nr:hypothetical protein CZ774_08535 [Frigoribacterium sp. JB110]
MNPAFWSDLAGVTLAWAFTSLIAFAIGIQAKTAILITLW